VIGAPAVVAGGGGGAAVAVVSAVVCVSLPPPHAMRANALAATANLLNLMFEGLQDSRRNFVWVMN
jgi:hypothetical protein